MKKLYAPPDSERVAKAVIDYFVTRPDVDANRIGLHGSSMGGYSGPRCATVEKRIKAVAVWSGAYNLVDDIFDYYPPIQDRLRWLMGAKDLKEAREKIKEFTLEGRADRIECPLLVGYSMTTGSWIHAAPSTSTRKPSIRRTARCSTASATARKDSNDEPTSPTGS